MSRLMLKIQKRASRMLVQHRFCKFPTGWFCAATRPRRTSPAGDFFGVFFPHIHEGIDNMALRVEHHPLEAAFAALLANGLDGVSNRFQPRPLFAPNNDPHALKNLG